MGVPFSDVADLILEAGYSTDVVQDARVRLLKDYPELEEEAYENAMSTVQPDSEAPPEWVEALLRELHIDYDPELLEP